MTDLAETTQSLSDVRANISHLEARARAMLRNTDQHVAHSGRSVFEVSRATVAEVTQNARRVASRSDQGFGESGAHVDLFMASLGFDVQEQRRLLQQMQDSHQQVSSRQSTWGGAPMGDPRLDGGDVSRTNAIFDVAEDLDMFLATRRAQAAQRCADEAHRQIVDRARDLAEQQIRTFWDRRSAEMCDAIEGRSHLTPTRGFAVEGAASARAPADGRPSEASTASRSGPLPHHLVAKMHAFAQIVETAQPHEWVALFNDYVQQVHQSTAATSSTKGAAEELAYMWSSVEHMLSGMSTNRFGSTAGSSSSTTGLPSLDGVQRYVASSRAVLERKYLARLALEVLRLPPSKVDELDAMHPSQIQSAVATLVSSGSNYWANVFYAMRCGRYDAAALIAQENGNRALQAALAAVDQAPVLTRNTLKSSLELRSQLQQHLHQQATASATPQADAAYCAAVLLLLLGGCCSGQDQELVAATFTQALDFTSQSVEDTLWMRLVCVRHVDASPPRLQSLADLQSSVLTDVPHLLAMPGSTPIKVASVLFHALLPSTALRMLQDTTDYAVDGVHMAMVFGASNLLRCGVTESVHSLPTALQTYALRIVLDRSLAQHAPTVARRVIPSLFHYFVKTDTISSFVEMCRNPVVCTHLFGQLGAVPSVPSSATDANSMGAASAAGLLISHASTVPPQPQLYSAMETIADLNAQSGQVELAVHILLALHRLASQCRDITTALEALQKAMCVINPALSHIAHTTGPCAARESLLMYAQHLSDRVAQNEALGQSRDAVSFQQLRSIVTFHACIARGEVIQGVQSILQLPFIPSQLSAVDACADRFNETVSDEVATALPPTVTTLLRMQLSILGQLRDASRTQAVEVVKAIVRWVGKWRFLSGGGRRDLMQELQAIEALCNA